MKTLSDFIGAIKTRQAEIASSLAAGNAASWDVYTRMVGHHAGLTEAYEILNTMLKEERDDE
jgi:hypothetical protein